MDSGSITYAHNGQGQRVSKDDGTKILFAYDETGRLIGEYDSLGAAIQETVYFDGAPVTVLEGTNKHYVHTDQLGTPRAITDGNTVIWRWESDPFGTTVAQEDPDGDSTIFTYNLRFPGQYYDDETGLHYNYFRDYDPVTGRYIESDPIGLVGGSNTYAYALGNPISNSDPTGEFVPAVVACALNPVCRTAATRVGAAALAFWNAYDTAKAARDAYNTVDDPCTVVDERLLAVGMLALVAVDPSPGNLSRKALPSPRNWLLNNATDKKLRNRINNLYRPNARIGNGGTADAVRHELRTGELLSPSGHFEKAVRERNGLLNDLASGRLNDSDTRIARQLLKDLQNALQGQ